MLGSFANVNIRTKILCGFGLSLALMGGVAGFLLWNVRALNDTFDDWSTSAMNAVYIVEAQRDVLQARLAVTKFEFSTEPEKLEAAVKEARDRALANYDALDLKLRNAERKALVREAQGLAQRYWETFDALVPHVKERFTIEAQVMKPVGDVLVDTLQKAAAEARAQGAQTTADNIDQALEPFLRARLAALRYLLQPDDANATTTRGFLAEPATSSQN